MYNFGLICWVGIIVIAIAIFIAEVLCKSKREGPVFIIREEGETIVPCTEDGFGTDLTPPKEVRKCKKCGAKIRNDRWFCSMKCKRAYLKGRK
jgi:hypothetical protein